MSEMTDMKTYPTFQVVCSSLICGTLQLSYSLDFQDFPGFYSLDFQVPYTYIMYSTGIQAHFNLLETPHKNPKAFWPTMNTFVGVCY